MVESNSTVTGRIAKVNGKGFKLEGQEAWLNVSKFAKPAPILPAVGELATVTLDKAGFVRAVEVQPAHPAQASTYTPAVVNGDGQQQPQGQGIAPDKDRTISRMAALNTATAILSSGGRPANVADVLALAAQLEAWTHRPL